MLTSAWTGRRDSTRGKTNEGSGNPAPLAMMRKSNYAVLLVDDSEDDRELMKMAIAKSKRFVVVGELEEMGSARSPTS